ncbi:MAG: hypothetical protein KAI83_08470 [Thiomargarita sp.]|nr:hypothetical protein [Thiomargarita sp.]
MFNQINLLDGFFCRLPSLALLKICSIILFMVSVFSAHAGVIKNLEAANEEINLSQSNNSSTDKHNHLSCEMVFFMMPFQQFDNGLVMGFSLGEDILGEDIYNPLIIKPVVLFGSNNLNIGIPLFSDRFDCWTFSLLNVQKRKELQGNEEQDYFFMNNRLLP